MSQTATATSPDPFAPPGVTFCPVSPRLVTVRLIGAWAGGVVLAAGLAVPGVLLSPWFHLGGVAALAGSAWLTWLVPRQVRAMGYALGEDYLLWRHGVTFRTLSVVPYGRMQFVDTSQGPLAAHYGIAKVRLHTASVSTDATINGLPAAEAEHLRRILAERGEQRMAGL